MSSGKMSSGEWLECLEKVIDKVESINLIKAWEVHKNWWSNFWERSYIFINDGINTEEITRGYILQRFMNACGG